MDKFNLRNDILRQHFENQTPLVKATLINFPAYLRQYSMSSMSRWCILNDAVRELHPAHLGLQDLDDNDPIFQELKFKYFTKDFLRLNKQDIVKMSNDFRSFVQFQKNSFLVTQILLNLTPDGWKEAIEIYFYFKQQMSNTVAEQQSSVSLMSLSLDGLRVFVMHELLQGDQVLAKKNVAAALQHYTMSAVVA